MLIANVLGIFLFLLLIWKRLKDDYHYEKIFNLCAFVLSGFLLGLVISKSFLPTFWFWIIVSGIVLGFGIGINRLKIKFFESFEGLIIGILPWTGLFFLSDAIINASLSSFLLFWFTLICVFLFYFLDSHYRRFTWYKSGRVGFAGVLTLAVFFVIRAIFFVSTYESYVSGTVAFLLFLLLFNLSRSKE
jgi:hypothetical protein